MIRRRVFWCLCDVFYLTKVCRRGMRGRRGDFWEVAGCEAVVVRRLKKCLLCFSCFFDASNFPHMQIV